MFWDVCLDALIDTAKLVPILLVVHLLIEFLEVKGLSSKANKYMGGALAPLIATGVGVIPQCGFSVVASNLYSKRRLSLAALVSVFIATSDEALPIMMSSIDGLNKLWPVLVIKVIFALVAGYSILAVGRIRDRYVKHKILQTAKQNGTEKIDNSNATTSAEKISNATTSASATNVSSVSCGFEKDAEKEAASAEKISNATTSASATNVSSVSCGFEKDAEKGTASAEKISNATTSASATNVSSVGCGFEKNSRKDCRIGETQDNYRNQTSAREDDKVTSEDDNAQTNEREHEYRTHDHAHAHNHAHEHRDEAHEHHDETHEHEGEEFSRGCHNHRIGATDENAGKFKRFYFTYLHHPLLHTATVTLYVFAITLIFGLIVAWIGEDKIEAFMKSTGYFQPLLAAVVGLIPNCAASVLITQMYVMGALNLGGVVSGLCVAAGVGYMVLIKENRPIKNTVMVIALMLALSVLIGEVITAVMSLF